eukprot:m.268290 g.268290  ORF g.268290 m.268290 type:complete len:53 (-) comp36120_c0_seq1:87-245(-)
MFALACERRLNFHLRLGFPAADSGVVPWLAYIAALCTAPRLEIQRSVSLLVN